jgi:hypothetical protein
MTPNDPSSAACVVEKRGSRRPVVQQRRLTGRPGEPTGGRLGVAAPFWRRTPPQEPHRRADLRPPSHPSDACQTEKIVLPRLSPPLPCRRPSTLSSSMTSPAEGPPTTSLLNRPEPRSRPSDPDRSQPALRAGDLKSSSLTNDRAAVGRTLSNSSALSASGRASLVSESPSRQPTVAHYGSQCARLPGHEASPFWLTLLLVAFDAASSGTTPRHPSTGRPSPPAARFKPTTRSTTSWSVPASSRYAQRTPIPDAALGGGRTIRLLSSRVTRSATTPATASRSTRTGGHGASRALVAVKIGRSFVRC